MFNFVNFNVEDSVFTSDFFWAIVIWELDIDINFDTSGSTNELFFKASDEGMGT